MHLNEYGIEGNLHSIRHTFITKMQKLKIKSFNNKENCWS